MASQKVQGKGDQPARMRALDPSGSFIVQAPAGSGKTGLLMQRFLVLLAGVEAPEEIVAITFTRKAAGEMRQRIVLALQSASRNEMPEEEHELRTWELARKALARDVEKGWQLIKNPTRLRIQTIDSLCMALVRQMPVLSRFGSVPAITQDPERLYLEAARSTVMELELKSDWSDAVAHLARCLDNRLDRLEELISTMLGHRDLWLRHIACADDSKLERGRLEDATARLVTDALQGLAAHFPRRVIPELITLLHFAADHLPHGSHSRIACCAGLERLPGVDLEHRNQWEGIAELLLTQGGRWRRNVNKNQGFPSQGEAADKHEKDYFHEMKERMVALLRSMEDQDALLQKLEWLPKLPPREYTDQEWSTLRALVQLLRVASAHLELVFRKHGQVDFTALVQAAITALGSADDPTDLALSMDYRIQHLLVDEFQDTSFSQFNLLELLTTGWQPGDGRTLFVVGDPMQSIYRFREAEVGLFFIAKEHGISQVQLEYLCLAVNFRSQQGVVDWINRFFRLVLPKQDSFNEGAVSFARSESFHPRSVSEAVTICPSDKRNDAAEAGEVVSIVREARSMSPEGTIAVLVRARTHLTEIARQLQAAGLRYQAVEIEKLSHRPLVQDLLALTRALNRLNDRIAWLAVLRAPYCGLTLADLHSLAGDDWNRTVLDLLHDEQRVTRLSPDGQRRVARVLPVLDAAISGQGRGSLRDSVEGTWITLGGPACVATRAGLEDGEVFFQLLEEIGEERDVPNFQELDKQVDQLFALPDAGASGTLQLMTIHKAKGLEFDTVILPGLGRVPKGSEEKLLDWLERGRESGASDLLLAPVSRSGEEKGPLASYLQYLDRVKGNFEEGRLLYVAATRARHRLYLLGHVQEQGGVTAGLKPQRNSLLACLWPAVEERYLSCLAGFRSSKEAGATGNATGMAVISQPMRTRLDLEWSLPAPGQPIEVHCSRDDENLHGREAISFDWAGETARHIGTVLHRLLQFIGSKGIENVNPAEIENLQKTGYTLLERLAVPKNRIKPAHRKVCAALRSTLEDERGRWVLSRMHDKAASELELSCVENRTVVHIIIDRTFVDEEGTRWIIDFKASTHGGKLEDFLDQEQMRYREQLEHYAEVMSRMENHPIRLGLYFPLLKGWREWSFPSGGPADDSS
ncbi:MAG: UvrD-helicase domain-containing protein [Gammaproteobacteria bacterium]|nr:UvrD-helicase domain-containing protein [Gammaproteobacteria bacterium]